MELFFSIFPNLFNLLVNSKESNLFFNNITIIMEIRKKVLIELKIENSLFIVILVNRKKKGKMTS